MDELIRTEYRLTVVIIKRWEGIFQATVVFDREGEGIVENDGTERKDE